MGTPWLGDACGLVEAFRAKEMSPLEAVDDCIAAMEALAPERVQLHRLRPGARGGRRRRPHPALRRCAVRGQGARAGGRLAVHGSLRRLQGPCRHRRRHVGGPPAHDRCGPRRADHGAASSAGSTAPRRCCTARRGIRGTWSARRAVLPAGRLRRSPGGFCPSPPAATGEGRSAARPGSAGCSGSRRRTAGSRRVLTPASSR